MSGIYIPKAKIPDGDYVRVLMLHKDGTCIDGIGNIFKVIPVPDHGRLIDADVICAECKRVAEEYDGIYPDCAYCPVNLAPADIEAMEGEG